MLDNDVEALLAGASNQLRQEFTGRQARRWALVGPVEGGHGEIVRHFGVVRS